MRAVSIKNLISVFAVAVAILAPGFAFAAGLTWTDQTASGARIWKSITSSSDGSMLAAVVNGGGIYVSTSSGATWTPESSAGSRDWSSITSSANGNILAAAVGDIGDEVNGSGDIYVSTDGGTTWTDETSAGTRIWASITSSTDGSLLAAAVDNGDIYISTTTGATWTDVSSALGSKSWASITSSSDGSLLAAAVTISGDIYISTTTGATWTDVTPSGSLHSQNWQSVSASSDGTVLVATEDNGFHIGSNIYVSTTTGATWTDITPSATEPAWTSLAVSSDGSSIATADSGADAGSIGGDIYVSADGGSTWVDQTSAGARQWGPVAMSADGTKLAAAVKSSGDIWTAYPAIMSATYDANTGQLVVTGANFAATSGTANDIVANKFTMTGEGGSTYTLTDTPNVDIASSSSFTLTLSATDKTHVNEIMNDDGTVSTGGTTYNLAAADDWDAGSTGNADLTGNVITVSNVAVPTITSATYDAGTGSLVVTGTNFLSRGLTNNDIVANKFTLTGEGGSTYTLTDTPNVDIASSTSFTLTLSTTDKAAVNMMMNNAGTVSSDNTTYNLAAATGWNTGTAASDADTTGNGITVSDVPLPQIASATYDVSTGSLVVTGTGFLSSGEIGTNAAGDINTTKFTVTGKGGSTYTLVDTPLPEITSGTSFTMVLGDDDTSAVNALLDKDGTSATDGTVYNLAAADDWDYGANPTLDISDLTNGITVSGNTDTTENTDTTAAVTGNGPIYTGPASALPGYVAPRPQIVNPDGSVVYLDATSTGAVNMIIPTVASSTLTSATTTSYHFTRDLKRGMTGSDVLALQQYLNAHNFTLAQSGDGSLGHETEYFGSLTKAALIAFQNANAAAILASVGLTEGTGYFGISTRAFVNSS